MSEKAVAKAKFDLVKTRIAPSPTGSPHVGSAYMALFNYALAKKNRGKFILRIEDTDRIRLVEGAEGEILKALEWLGLKWDEGPFRQSERLSLYQQYARQLVKAGKAYYCFCSQERLDEVRLRSQKEGRQPMYDRLCRKIDPKTAAARAEREKFVVRLKVPDEGETAFEDLIRGEIRFENKVLDDQVLLKSDGYPTYHLGVVVDDHLMGITHVIRGEEWLSSTPKHILLYKAFGWEVPVLAHFPLLREATHAKLSKRHGSVSILDFREEGYLPEALLNYLALLGWTHPKGEEIFSLADFIKNFEISGMNPTAPVFDREKLAWMNGEYIRQLDSRQLAGRIETYLKEVRGVAIDKDLLNKSIPLIRERIKRLSEYEEMAGFFFKDVAWEREILVPRETSGAEVAERLRVCAEALEKLAKWSARELEERLRKIAGEKEWKAPDLFMLLRVAVTGKTVSPPLFESLEVLGREKSLARIKRAAAVAL